MPQAPARLLLVDDEPSVLDALQRTHRKRYQITLAVGGRAGLQAIATGGPFDVVVSDYRMPEMNGAAFLAEVAKRAPDCMRIMLTGNADLETAIDAVNTGRVFRFLTKPCEPDVFVLGIEAALEQVRLVRAERELLEGTLQGSIEVLSEVLALSNPDAFGRANRVRGYVSQLAAMLSLQGAWQVESAALLSQIGCIALPNDVVERAAAGEELRVDQREAYERHPEVGARLLERIPRLETVAAIVARQRRSCADLCGEIGLCAAVGRGSQILSACIEFDELVTRGKSRGEALAAMAARPGGYAPDLLRLLAQVKTMVDGAVPRNVMVAELRDGMVLTQDVLSQSGTLVVSAGQRVTRSMLERLRNYHHLRGIQEPLRVLVAGRGAADAA